MCYVVIAGLTLFIVLISFCWGFVVLCVAFECFFVFDCCFVCFLCRLLVLCLTFNSVVLSYFVVRYLFNGMLVTCLFIFVCLYVVGLVV